ncbi:MAG TPA: NAD-dependent epimerase/dehydratase family protein [Acidiferrobacter sp.]|nr:NAD-dependent epimerase/dehydratase family protein [Acidiferrobacter sp.]
MRVLITGAAGCLGRALLPALLADRRISVVIGHDIRPLSLKHHRLMFLQGDIRDPALRETVKGVDAVIHMAFVVIESQLGRERANRARAQAINLGGIDAILATLPATARLIHLSSASVYGTNPYPLTESAPLRPLPGFGYAHDKALVEERLIEAEAGGLRCLRLRPHVILGPNAQPFLRGVLRWPFYPRLADPAPQLQVVHEHDVVAAIQAGLFADATGAVNLACEDSLSFQEMQKACHRITIGVRPAIARAAVAWAFRYLGIGPDPAWGAGLELPLVLDCARARDVLGWQPRFPQVVDVLAHR